jgi:general stress protein 26
MAQENQNPIEKVKKLIHGIRIAMLTTVDTDGSIRGRPMATQDTDFDGTLWFFTRASSHKVEEATRNFQVGAQYSDPDGQRYVSLSGKAELVQDKATLKAKWSPLVKAWFPKGLEDPELALLKIDVVRGEYWDAPSSKIVELVGLAKATLTGQPLSQDAMGEHAEVRMH